MSSKSNKKATSAVPAVVEPIITRTKSGQKKRQATPLPTKDNKAVNEKPKLTEIKSPKTVKKVKCSKDALLENKTKKCEDMQVEYYPNKLKRNICAKKIMLKPKHNFKVIASTNKRKLTTPHKEIKSPPAKKLKVKGKFAKSSKITRTCSPELNMQDMVRLMEETRSLSDEDFMEILTCPSPVWWEDPPDGSYIEGSIYTRTPLPIRNKKDNKTSNTDSTCNTDLPSNASNTEKNVPTYKKDEKFTKKQLKLEDVLGNIKNKTKKSVEYNKNETKRHEKVRGRQLSESTEGDCSDVSFNEEEILKNLENMDIPIEQPQPSESEQVKTKKEIENEYAIKTEKVKLDILPPIKVNSEIKGQIINSPDSNLEKDFESSFQLNEGSLVNVSEITDEITLNSCTSVVKDEVIDSTDQECSSSLKDVNLIDQNDMRQHANDFKTNKNDFFRNIKAANDLTEYITVYKIIPDKNNTATNTENAKPIETNNNSKTDSLKGKLNNFFKQSKNSKRFKKPENPAASKIPLKDKKETIDSEKENSEKTIDLQDEKNRLKHCEYCIQKTVNGTTVFSCDKCELAPILPCDSCNFLADSKEVYKKHISSCKDVARISWNHNLVLNQT